VQFDWFDNVNHNSEIIALGNSRTWWHLDPFAIMDATKKSCELLSANGQGTTLVYQKLLNYLKNNKNPEFIILQFDPHFFNDGGTMFQSYNWSPGYFFNRIKFGGAKKFKGYKYHYAFMPIWGIDRSTRVKILTNDKIGFDSLFEKRRGFFPVNAKWNAKAISSIVSVPNIENYYDSIILFAQKQNIKLILLTPPYSPDVNHANERMHNQLQDRYEAICKKYNKNFPWINLQNPVQISDTSFFTDRIHLNSKGARVFSDIVAEKMKILVNQ
jgi:hypothetical protein